MFVAAGYLLALGWTLAEARRLGLDQGKVPDLGLWVLLGGFLGARLLYVAIHPLYFWAHPLEIVMVWKGGLVLFGGVLSGALLGLVFMRKMGLPLRPWLDALAPGLVLGQGVGRLGCLSAGCCYGETTDLPWGLVFTDPDSLARPLGLALHPTQAYHAASDLAVFALLVAVRSRVKVPGRLMGLGLFLSAAFRLLIECFRADFRGELGPFTVTQVLALGILGLGAGLLVHKPKEKKA